LKSRINDDTPKDYGKIGNACRYTDNASEDIEFAQKGIEIVQSA